MRNLLLPILILISFSVDAQIPPYLSKTTFDLFIVRYKIDTAASNKSIRDLQGQMIALTNRVVNLEAFQSAQMIKNTDFAAAIKTLQLDVATLQKNDSIYFDTTYFLVIDNKYVSLSSAFVQRITSLESWRTLTQPMIDSLMAYMDRLKKTVFVNPFPQ